MVVATVVVTATAAPRAKMATEAGAAMRAGVGQSWW
jgi:hypothetical protein